VGCFPSVKEFSLCGVVVPSPGLVATGPFGPVARVLGPFLCVSVGLGARVLYAFAVWLAVLCASFAIIAETWRFQQALSLRHLVQYGLLLFVPASLS
jgi:hypothetical protein